MNVFVGDDGVAAGVLKISVSVDGLAVCVLKVSGVVVVDAAGVYGSMFNLFDYDELLDDDDFEVNRW